ncbi:ATP-binding protein [Roseomonas sp. 18066]|uniref:chemotaxis protein CheA n=1 Tax=Roseomonas sp. 18066 TaxID=2681412 RepID=UPI001356D441|nr:ATP-binding protein [Roseomonas sp. 18066]
MLGEDDALWGEFAAETEEHLDTIEAVLGGGGAALEREQVNTLFRAFHSLKGMSDALGAPGMKNVAHVAEDILGNARSGRLVVDAAVSGVLLGAVDALRRQRAAVLATHQDMPADPALIAQLQRIAGGSPAAPPAKPAPPPAVAATEKNPLVGVVASRVVVAVPLLGHLAGETVAARDPAALQEVEELAEAAALLGLPRLSAGFSTLAEAAGSIAALPALGLLRRQLERLEDMAGESAGAAEIPGATRGELAPRLAGLAVRLAALTEGHGDAPALAAAARAAAAAACALGQEALETLLLTLEDLADRAADPDAAAVLAIQGPALAERLHAAAEGETLAPRALPPAEAAAEALDPRLPPAFRGSMGAAARGRALAALAAGQRLFVARLALGQDAGIENAIGAWLHEEAEVLASRNLPPPSPELAAELETLFASGAELSLLQTHARALDPDHRVLRDLALLPEAGIEHAEAGPVTMRVRQETIDGIINLQAEVRAAALSLSETLQEGGGRGAIGRLAALEQWLPGSVAPHLANALERLRRVQDAMEGAESRLTLSLRRLDEAVMELRVVPIGTLFSRLPRVARAVARASGKEVELLLEGQEVAIDRSLVELLADPLLHLVRNAVDHGIESPAAREAAGKPAKGTLKISAARRTGQIRVRLSDDGAGIDRDRVLARAVSRGLISSAEAARMPPDEVHGLLFRPGFSTAETVTETSGRGVGLDVVQDAVRRAGGTLEVTSEPGQGSSFALRLPLTAAVQTVLLVEVGGHAYALPAGRVDSVVEHDALPPGAELRRLSDLLNLPPDPAASEGAIVMLRSGGRVLGLAVDRVQRRSDLLLRPMHPALAGLPGVGGVGVLGNGEPVVLLEPDGM